MWIWKNICNNCGALFRHQRREKEKNVGRDFSESFVGINRKHKQLRFLFDGYGPFGKPRKTASLWKRVRLKKHRKRKGLIAYYEVQKKSGRRWVSLGCFDTENEALAILEDEVEIMKYIEAVRERLDYAGSEDESCREKIILCRNSRRRQI